MKMIALAMLGLLLCGCEGQFIRFKMATGAMIPTIAENGHVIADTSEAEKTNIRRWDMIVFKAPETVRLYGYVHKTLPKYVMRVVGLPGETIDIEGPRILIDGKEMVLPPNLAALNYSGLSGFPPGARRLTEPPRINLGPEEYFILGDRTKTALDSRFVGPLPKENVVGKVIRIE